MKRLIFSFFFCLVISTEILAQSPFSPEVDTLILKGIDQTFFCKFDSALLTFQKIIDRYPDDLVGYFYQAATLQSEMMHYETDIWGKDFDQLIEKAISLGKEEIANGNNDPWTYFYLGSSFSYKGLYQAKTGSYISGFMSARKGLNYLKKAVEEDSTLYDAYLGLGTYKYWAGRFYKYLKWLPWIRDEREEGVRMVKYSVEKGTFSHWVGINSLAWIEYDRKNYWSALLLFQKGLRRYPGSPFFLWGVADSYYRLGYFVKAIEVYKKLLKIILDAPLNNGYNEIECRLKLGMSYYALGEYQNALAQYNTILGRKTEKKVAGRLKKHYRLAKEYKKQCLKALKRRETP